MSDAAAAAGDCEGDVTDVYTMSNPRRCRLIIINNENFKNDPENKYFREGSEKDAKTLQDVFTEIGFTVELAKDMTAYQMLTLMTAAKEALEADEARKQQCDCLAVVVLTHGGKEKVKRLVTVTENGKKKQVMQEVEMEVLYGTDWEPITVDNLLVPFKGCTALAKKPKLFFFQACRGDQQDSGVEADDGVQSPPVRKIPIEADFLYAYSTPPGYGSWRDPVKDGGSWFIRALCAQLKQHHRDLDLVRILTRVNKQIAFERESQGFRQVSSIVSMLTKDLYFHPEQLQQQQKK